MSRVQASLPPNYTEANFRTNKREFTVALAVNMICIGMNLLVSCGVCACPSAGCRAATDAAAVSGVHDGVHDVCASHLRAEHHIAHDRLHLHVRFHHGVLVRFLACAQRASRALALAHTA